MMCLLDGNIECGVLTTWDALKNTAKAGYGMQTATPSIVLTRTALVKVSYSQSCKLVTRHIPL